jgi:hypothetical protein
MSYQPAILQAIPAHASYLTWTIRSGANRISVQQSLHALLALTDGDRIVTGIGAALAKALDLSVSGLQEFTGIAGSQVSIPATPAALWIWLRAEERGELVHQQLRIAEVLTPALNCSTRPALSGTQKAVIYPVTKTARKIRRTMRRWRWQLRKPVAALWRFSNGSMISPHWQQWRNRRKITRLVVVFPIMKNWKMRRNQRM